MLKPLVIAQCIVLPTEAESHVPWVCPTQGSLFHTQVLINGVTLMAHPNIYQIHRTVGACEGDEPTYPKWQDLLDTQQEAIQEEPSEGLLPAVLQKPEAWSLAF